MRGNFPLSRRLNVNQTCEKKIVCKKYLLNEEPGQRLEL